MRLIDADALRKCVLKWLPHDPCGIQEKEMPFETDICVSMIMEIDEQPTIQLKLQWIPVTERLPEEEDDYLVTLSTEIVDVTAWNGNRWETWIQTNEWVEVKNVVAWMPFPEPFKEVAE